MNTRHGIVAAVVLAVLAAGCTAPDEASDLSGDVEAPDADVVVNYTVDGFTPGTVTVQQGQTVAWVDRNPTADMWVASNVHPTHAEYAGTSMGEHCNGDAATAFDQCQAGETYTFTFQQTGSWSYHNHRRANDGGTVVVE